MIVPCFWFQSGMGIRNPEDWRSGSGRGRGNGRNRRDCPSPRNCGNSSVGNEALPAGGIARL